MTLTQRQIRILQEKYYQGGGFQGMNKLWQAVKHHGITDRDTRAWVAKQEIYQLYKPVKNNEIVDTIDAGRPLARWQADLVDMSRWSGSNTSKAWLLTIIDVFTKFGYVVPLKTKHGKVVADGLRTVLSQLDVQPTLLHSDNGLEFKNSHWYKVCDDFGVKRAYGKPHSPWEQGVVERFNKTIKERMKKHMNAYGTKRWIDIHKKLVENYNSEWHTAIKMSPNQARLPENLAKVASTLKIRKKRVTADTSRVQRFQIGDTVRLKVPKVVKGKPFWSEELYDIDKVVFKNGIPVYKIDDFPGFFQNNQLQLIIEVQKNPFQIRRRNVFQPGLRVRRELEGLNVSQAELRNGAYSQRERPRYTNRR